ncbi:hypothetical protein [Hyalangium versicolor]|uniref:hypothetical protein n=1 Tax=Hyalangium versicolor TaxID=2861190 RepID=UPI001CCF9BA5|nr:hypothetical protein [Hyalangium versicolor]
MKSIHRSIGLLTASFLVGGLVGCGPELSESSGNPEPSRVETRAAPLTVDPEIHTTLSPTGGSGGNEFSDSCPVGYVGTGLSIRSGDWLDQVQLICRKLNLDGTLGDTAYTPERGGWGGWPSSGSCPDDQIMTEELLGGDPWARQVGAQCSTATRLKDATGGFDSTLSPLGREGDLWTEACPAGSAITGIYGHAGNWVDQVGFLCSKIDNVPSPASIDMGFHFTLSNVSINGSIIPSATVPAGQNFLLDLDYSVQDTNCPGCYDQIIVGLVSSDPAVPQQPLACVYDGMPMSGDSGHSQLSLPAPTQPGTYTLRVHYGQDISCNTAWWTVNGTPGPETIIGEIEVQ